MIFMLQLYLIHRKTGWEVIDLSTPRGIEGISLDDVVILVVMPVASLTYRGHITLRWAFPATSMSNHEKSNAI